MEFGDSRTESSSELAVRAALPCTCGWRGVGGNPTCNRRLCPSRGRRVRGSPTCCQRPSPSPEPTGLRSAATARATATLLSTRCLMVRSSVLPPRMQWHDERCEDRSAVGHSAVTTAQTTALEGAKFARDLPHDSGTVSCEADGFPHPWSARGPRRPGGDLDRRRQAAGAARASADPPERIACDGQVDRRALGRGAAVDGGEDHPEPRLPAAPHVGRRPSPDAGTRLFTPCRAGGARR